MTNNIINILRIFMIITIIVISLLLAFFLVPNKYSYKILQKIDDFLEKCNIKKIRIAYVVFSIILATSYIYLPGLIEGHDLIDRLANIQAIANEIERGHFPALILTDYLNGYGTGLELIYTEFFYYIPALLCAAGVPLKIAYKVFKVLIVFGCSYSMYFCTHKITKSDFIATITSSVYILSSYFIVDLYIRADLGENLAMIFIPLIILGLYEIIFDDEKKGYYLTLGLVGIYLSHILSCFLSIFLVLLIVLLNIKKLLYEKKKLKYLFLYGFLSVGIVTYFWFTMFEAMFGNNLMIANNQGVHDISENLVNPIYSILELFYHSGTNIWIPPGIGVVFVILFIISIKYIISKKCTKYSYQLLICGTVFYLLSTEISPKFLYRSIFSIMEFPWRFYMFATCCLLIGYSDILSKNQEDRNRNTILITLCILLSYSIFSFNLFIEEPMYISSYELRYPTASGYGLPLEVNKNAIQKRGKIITSNNSDIQFRFIKNGTDINIHYLKNYKDNTYLDLPLVYYKNYYAIENDKYLKIEKSPEGYVRINLNNIEGEVFVNYGFTNISKIGLALSAASTIVFLYFVITIRRESFNKIN